jgi:hypothetical protein
VYNYDKWPINVDKSYVFPYLEKGSNYLLKEFPDEKTYQDSKEKIEDHIIQNLKKNVVYLASATQKMPQL